MTVPVSPLVGYINADGKLSMEGLRLLQSLIDRVQTLEATTTAQQTTIDDHETRITALEP